MRVSIDVSQFKIGHMCDFIEMSQFKLGHMFDFIEMS